jgi:hypothetical protein
MKIKIENTLVEFTPESDSEKKELSALWDLLVDCAQFNRKLDPVGEFVPQKSKVARFNIEDR